MWRVTAGFVSNFVSNDLSIFIAHVMTKRNAGNFNCLRQHTLSVSLSPSVTLHGLLVVAYFLIQVARPFKELSFEKGRGYARNELSVLHEILKITNKFTFHQRQATSSASSLTLNSSKPSAVTHQQLEFQTLSKLINTEWTTDIYQCAGRTTQGDMDPATDLSTGSQTSSFSGQPSFHVQLYGRHIISFLFFQLSRFFFLNIKITFRHIIGWRVGSRAQGHFKKCYNC